MPKTKGKCPKEQRDGHKRMDFNRRVLFLCFCATDPFPAKRKREERQNLKNLKKKQTPLKRDIPHQNLSLQNDSNTRARIKQQQEQQRRGRSFERAKASENNYSGFLSKRRRRREDGFVVYFFVRFYDENHVDARKSPKSSREI